MEATVFMVFSVGSGVRWFSDGVAGSGLRYDDVFFGMGAHWCIQRIGFGSGPESVGDVSVCMPD